MSDSPPHDLQPPPRPPWHLWAVGLASLLWNFWGAYLALSAQSGTLPALRATYEVFFHSQPLWFLVVTDLALVAGIAGALALLLLHRSAVWLYSIDLVILLLSNGFEIATGTSPLQGGIAWLTPASLAAIQLGETSYALAMRRRGVLE